MTNRPFSFIPAAAGRTTAKPRKTGVSMMIDMGLGPALIDDHLTVCGAYVDLAKIFVGSAMLYDEKTFAAKAEVYAKHDIDIFIGGQFLEYVITRQGYDAAAAFFDEVKRIGVTCIEVSDNCIEMSDDQRRLLVGRALDAGLEVHGEVGSKHHFADVDELIRQSQVCLEAGCDVVLFEAAELVSAGIANTDSIERIKAAVPAEQVMIELPGPWIEGVTLNNVFEMAKQTLKIFGPDANLGNVAWDQVINVECLRQGIGIAGPDYLDG